VDIGIAVMGGGSVSVIEGSRSRLIGWAVGTSSTNTATRTIETVAVTHSGQWVCDKITILAYPPRSVWLRASLLVIRSYTPPFANVGYHR